MNGDELSSLNPSATHVCPTPQRADDVTTKFTTLPSTVQFAVKSGFGEYVPLHSAVVSFTNTDTSVSKMLLKKAFLSTISVH